MGAGGWSMAAMDFKMSTFRCFFPQLCSDPSTSSTGSGSKSLLSHIYIYVCMWVLGHSSMLA